MKIVDRYMAKGFIFPFIWCLSMFTVMAIIIDIFSFIDRIVKYKIPAGSIVAFYVYYSPTMLIQIIPMAVLLSTIYILSNLNRHNEIIALRTSGLSLWRILCPIIIIGLLISMAVFIVNDRIVPKSSRIANTIRRDELEKHKMRAGNRTIRNVAVYGSGNRIIFARNYDTKNKTLEDIIIHEHDSGQNLISKTTATKGAWTKKGWKFSEVVIYKTDNTGKILGKPLFSKERIIDVKEKPSDFAKREWRSEFLSYKELKSYITNFRGAGTRLIRGLLVDLYYKISFAFIILIIILIASPFALITTRGGVILGVGMGVAIGLIYYGVIAVSIAFGKAGILPPVVSAWLGNVIFAVLGIYLVNKRN